MAIKNQNRLKNRLLNRVQRHTRMSTIFQSMNPEAQNEIQNPGSPRQSGIENIWNDTPAAVTAFLPTEEHPQIPLSKPPLSQEKRFNSRESGLKQAIARAENPDPPLDNPSEISTPLDIDNKKIDDNLWLKLKRISKLHQEPAKDFGSEQTTETTLQMATENSPESKNKDKTLRRELNDHATRQDESFESDAHLDHEEFIPSHPTPMPDVQKNMNNQESQVDSKDDEFHTEKILPSTTMLDSTGLRTSEIEHKKEIINDLDRLHPDTDNERTPEMDRSPNDPLDEMTPEPHLQSVPLEAAWPVQKKSIEPDDHKDITEGDTTPFEQIATDKIPPTKTEFSVPVPTDTIQDLLQIVAPHQPTASSIELITPSRPRPKYQKTIMDAEIGNKPKIPAKERLTTHPVGTQIQNDIDSELLSESEDPSKSVEKSVKEDGPTGKTSLPLVSASKNQTAVESEDENTYSSNPTDLDDDEKTIHNEPSVLEDFLEVNYPPEADMIQTEIGELPADLWVILDQPPPVSDEEETDFQNKPQQIQQEADILTSSGVGISERKSQKKKSEVTRNIDAGPAVIQRDAAQSAVGNSISSDTSTTVSSGDTDQETEQSQSSRVDISELSRRVYAEIRRKLSVEWERSRIP